MKTLGAGSVAIGAAFTLFALTASPAFANGQSHGGGGGGGGGGHASFGGHASAGGRSFGGGGAHYSRAPSFRAGGYSGGNYGGGVARSASGGRAVIGDPHRVAEFRAADDAGLDGALPLTAATQRTRDHTRLIDVDMLADERRAVAARASLGTCQALIEALAQKRQLEVEHVAQRVRHRNKIRSRERCSSLRTTAVPGL